MSTEQKAAFVREKSCSPKPPGVNSPVERHYTAHEVATILHLSDDKVRRMFQNEPGVLVIGDQAIKHKRRYRTLRIPEFVLHRVIPRISNV